MALRILPGITGRELVPCNDNQVGGCFGGGGRTGQPALLKNPKATLLEPTHHLTLAVVIDVKLVSDARPASTLLRSSGAFFIRQRFCRLERVREHSRRPTGGWGNPVCSSCPRRKRRPSLRSGRTGRAKRLRRSGDRSMRRRSNTNLPHRRRHARSAKAHRNAT